MIDHLLGRPSPSWKRVQVFLVIIFWVWRVLQGNPGGPRLLWLRRANRALERFTPWQLVVSTLTGVYAVRNLDKILGFQAPEPLADLYSRSYYRATWISTALDAGFATAMSIRPKFLKDLCSAVFAMYYLVYANEADEKLRKYRAVPTVEMLRTTGRRPPIPTSLRFFTYFPKMTIRRKIVLPRPHDSTCTRPITAWLFFAPPVHQLARATDLILDYPGGGFISMTPEHHEERLRMWAFGQESRFCRSTMARHQSVRHRSLRGKCQLTALTDPYPFAIDECFDVYRMLIESGGKVIGMAGHKLNIIISGDSAGAHVAANVMVKILESQLALPLPKALVFAYPALDFNFTSWMAPDNLRVLQSEQSSGHIPDLAAQKDHLRHISPLSMVGDRKGIRRRRSWREALRKLASPTDERSSLTLRHSTTSSTSLKGRGHAEERGIDAEAGEMADVEDSADVSSTREEDMPLQARVRFHPRVEERVLEQQQREADATIPEQGEPSEHVQLGTRLTMTSRTGYFSDRIISPSMMRAMAILYIGPHRNPDFATDYHLSPIKAPSHLLTQFPPILMACGEKDPFVDDTLIFAGRVREAKRARRRDLDAALSGKGAKSIESFILSKDHLSQEEALRALRRERDMLAAQGDEDWVTMQIYSEWSHGFLQMPMLLPEARTVIDSMADWMDEAFTNAGSRSGAAARRNNGATASRVGVKRPSPSRRPVLPPIGDGLNRRRLDDLPKKRTSPPASFVETDSEKNKTSPRKNLEQAASGKDRDTRVQTSSYSRTDDADAVTAEGALAATPRFDLLHDLLGQTVPVGQAKARRDSSPSSKASTPGKAGQIIQSQS
ncbi:Alpha/Beta hydrolase protein [Fomitopsis serialis]|uniref:Alpha/Beta hydrolase protein n=1 Tax=Fomitopsis serialis TaxID=139415 RepID=UPI002008CE6B|nr:Alpha/Beta hydrolase protein [Neoantrodia serialis]KAH9935329.1 Alpha/Beta hydrolase protein [Neoantrodia serialis]